MKKEIGVNPIKAAFVDALKAAGFSKKSDTWYLEKDETILLANLQKSQYGQQYYINLGVWVKQLGAAKFPKEHECHIRMRASALASDEERVEKVVLNLEDMSLSSDERYREVWVLMTEIAVPFLISCSSLSGIKDEFTKSHLAKGMVRKELKKLLLKSV